MKTDQSNKVFMQVRARLLFAALLLVAVSVSATPVYAQPFAYVTNYNSNDVSVFDTETNTLVATVPVGSHPSVWRSVQMEHSYTW